jgi:hypothetical protein
VIKEDESEVVLRDGEFVDPSRVYFVLVVVLAVALSAKVRVLQTVSVDVMSLYSWHEFVELVCGVRRPPK